MNFKQIFLALALVAAPAAPVMAMDGGEFSEDQMYALADEHFQGQLGALDESMRTHCYRIFMMTCGAALCNLYLNPSWSDAKTAYADGTWEWSKLLGTGAFALFASQESLALLGDALKAGNIHQQREMLFARIRGAQEGQSLLQQAQELAEAGDWDYEDEDSAA